MHTVTVNALDDQCPIPVVKAKRAMQEMSVPGTLIVQVDNTTAVENLKKLAAASGFAAVSEQDADGNYAVTITVDKQVSADADCACGTAKRTTVVAIGSAAMGEGSEELGKTLMKGFIYAVSQLETLPDTVLFYNGGASIPTEGSVSLEDLKFMESQGVEILTCGTCLNFYGLADKLAVGSVTNMYSIVEKLNAADRIIKP